MEPTLVQLCREAPCVAPDTPAADVARRFADDAELSSIVVTTDPPALLSRRRVTALIDGGTIGGTTAVLDLVEDEPLLLPPTVALHIAAREAMARPIELRFDDAVVVTDDAPRVLPVSELLLALAHHHEQGSDVDTLTGLPSRNAFRRRLASALEDDRAAVTVLFVDLDRFKLINDTLGHAAGDEALRIAAERLRSTLRPTDVVCRAGGDEFLVMLHGERSDTELDHLTSRLRTALAEPADLGGIQTVLTASIGWANGVAGSDPDDLVHDADVAMYRQKQQTGSTWIQADGTPLAMLGADRLQLEFDFRRAVEHGALHAEFQPIVAIDGADVVAFEALARWTDPEWGQIEPDRFLPLAHTIGWLDRVDDLVMTRALNLARRLPDHQRVAVNRSVSSLTRPDAVERLESLRSDTGVAPDRIEIEVSELILVDELDRLRHPLLRLRELGYRIALDDFGTGRTSLLHLASLPLSSIKIDRILVTHPAAEDILGPVLELAHARGIALVAEGVEDTASAQRAGELGCDHAQGFHIARPARAGSLAAAGWIPDAAVMSLG